VSVLFCMNFCHLRLCYLAHLGSINDFCLSVCLSVWLWNESPIISVDVRKVSGISTAWTRQESVRLWKVRARFTWYLHNATVCATNQSCRLVASCKHLAVKPRLTTGWTTGCIVYTNIQPVVKPVRQPAVQLYSRLDNRLHRANKHPTCCQTGCTTGLTTGWIV